MCKADLELKGWSEQRGDLVARNGGPVVCATALPPTVTVPRKVVRAICADTKCGCVFVFEGDKHVAHCCFLLNDPLGTNDAAFAKWAKDELKGNEVYTYNETVAANVDCPPPLRSFASLPVQSLHRLM